MHPLTQLLLGLGPAGLVAAVLWLIHLEDKKALVDERADHKATREELANVNKQSKAEIADITERYADLATRAAESMQHLSTLVGERLPSSKK